MSHSIRIYILFGQMDYGNKTAIVDPQFECLLHNIVYVYVVSIVLSASKISNARYGGDKSLSAVYLQFYRSRLVVLSNEPTFMGNDSGIQDTSS